MKLTYSPYYDRDLYLGKDRIMFNHKMADYKNFSAPEDFGKKAVLNEKDADRYAGHHAPQLGEYRAALMEEGYEVIACVIYYSVLGMTIQLDFI